MLTLEERYNRKRTPIVSRPELVMAPLVEPEVAGSQNPVAEKVVAPVTPVNYSQGMDSVPPIGDSGKEGDTPPKLSDFHFFKDFTDKYSETPITQEEEEKRKRAASAVTGIGHIGNALSSLSNILFAGEAPSQKIPTVADPGIQRFEDRIADKRRQYAVDNMRAANMDYNRFMDAYNQYWSQKDRDMANKKYQDNQDWQQRQFDFQREQAKATQERWQKQFDANNRQWWASYNLSKNRIGNQQVDTQKDKENISTWYGANGRIFNIPKSKEIGISNFLLQRMRQIANAKPIGERSRTDQALLYGDVNSADLRNIVMQNLPNYPELYDGIDKLAGTSLQYMPSASTENATTPYAHPYSGDLNAKLIGWGVTPPSKNARKMETPMNNGRKETEVENYVPQGKANNTDGEKFKFLEEKPNEDIPPSNKYERFLFEKRKEEEKERREKELWVKRVRDYRLKDEQSLYDRISELESQMVKEIDPEKFIKENGLGTMDSARIRMMANEDRTANARLRREIDRLYKEIQKKYPYQP